MPELTVVLVVDRRRDRGVRSLSAILGQSAMDQCEVLLFDFAHGARPPLPGSDHSAVTTVPVSGRTSLGAIRRQALERAGSPWLVFVDEHALVMPGWAEALIARTQTGECVGIGCEVHNMRPGTPSSDAHYLMHFQRFAAPAEPGPVDWVPPNNSAYQRDFLLALGDELDTLLEMEPLLDYRIRQRGGVIITEPNARTRHGNESDLLAYWESNFTYSWLLGALRGEVQDWTARDRLVRVLGVPLWPWLRAARLLRFAAKKHPEVVASVLRGLPAVIVSQYASVLGQALGIVFGERGARYRFVMMALDAPRDEPPA